MAGPATRLPTAFSQLFDAVPGLAARGVATVIMPRDAPIPCKSGMGNAMST